MTSILLVEDDQNLRDRLARAFVDRELDVVAVDGHAAAIEVARTRAFDRAVVDMKMDGPSGLVVVHDLRELHPGIQIVVVTGYGSIATAVEAIRLGAHNYLTKPIHADQILAAFETESDDPAAELEFNVPTLAQVEREHIERILQECNGNISKAARMLRMHRRSLQYKLAKFPTKG